MVLLLLATSEFFDAFKYSFLLERLFILASSPPAPQPPFVFFLWFISESLIWLHPLLTWLHFLPVRLVHPIFQNHFGVVCYNNGTCWIAPFSDCLKCLCNVTLLLHHPLESCWPCDLLRQVKSGRCDIAQNLKRHCCLHSCLLAYKEAGVKDAKPYGRDKLVQVSKSLIEAILYLPVWPDNKQLHADETSRRTAEPSCRTMRNNKSLYWDPPFEIVTQ